MEIICPTSSHSFPCAGMRYFHELSIKYSIWSFWRVAGHAKLFPRVKIIHFHGHLCQIFMRYFFHEPTFGNDLCCQKIPFYFHGPFTYMEMLLPLFGKNGNFSSERTQLLFIHAKSAFGF
jgi:hypothetical protein